MREYEADIELVVTSKIKPSKKNARVHSSEQIDFLCDVITEFGFDQPIVVTSSMEVIKGHGRLLAAKKLKMKKVPALIRSDMTDAYADLSRIVDNDTVETDWDEETLLLEAGSIDKLDENLGATINNRISHLLDKDDDDLFDLKPTQVGVTMSFRHTCPHCDYKWD